MSLWLMNLGSSGLKSAVRLECGRPCTGIQRARRRCIRDRMSP